MDAIRKAACERHNILVVGQPGTGKSTLLMSLAQSAKQKGLSVHITASTGIASASLGGVTIHKYTGIMDGRYSVQQVVHRLNDDRFISQKQRIIETDVLLIDEVSMLSAAVFQKIEGVLRGVRDSQLPFGGIQVLLFGDFKQLKPVPNHSLQDPGDLLVHDGYINKFLQLVPHHFVLNDVKRQSEGPLVRAIHELCSGTVSAETDKYLSDISGKPSMTQPQVALYARNFDVAIANSEKLLSHTGDSTVYKSTDTGVKIRLQHLTVPQYLHFKVGAPVVLLTNLNDTLVNGRRGIIAALHSDSVSVMFENSGSPISISTFDFTVYDSRKNEVVATRRQIPLMLAWALTVHRAQGMTFDSVFVDCSSMFQPGQIGVAVGRVRSVSGLSLLHYDRNLVSKQPLSVEEFYSNIQSKQGAVSLLCDISCCRGLLVDQPTSAGNTVASRLHVEPVYDASTDYSSDNDSNISDDADILRIDTLVLTHLATTKHSDPTTLTMQSVNDAISHICLLSSRSARMKFIDKIWTVLDELYTSHLGSSQANKNVTAFYSGIQSYLSSTEYKRYVERLFSEYETPDVNSSTKFRVCYAIIEQLRMERVRLAASALTILSESRVEITSEYDSHSISSIRHIGGWAINKLIKARRDAILRHMYNAHMATEVSIMKSDLLILESLITRERSPADSTAVETLRKEYVTGSLKLPTPAVAELLVHLDKVIVALEKSEEMIRKGGDMYTSIIDNLLNDKQLEVEWKRITNSDNVMLLHLIMEKYTVLSASQFIRRFKESENIKRKKPHRTEQQIPSKRKP